MPETARTHGNGFLHGKYDIAAKVVHEFTWINFRFGYHEYIRTHPQPFDTFSTFPQQHTARSPPPWHQQHHEAQQSNPPLRIFHPFPLYHTAKMPARFSLVTRSTPRTTPRSPFPQNSRKFMVNRHCTTLISIIWWKHPSMKNSFRNLACHFWNLPRPLRFCIFAIKLIK